MQQHSGVRWIIPVLIVVVLASAFVIYQLISLTSPGPDGTSAGPSPSGTTALTGQPVSRTSSITIPGTTTAETSLSPSEPTTDATPPSTPHAPSQDPTTTAISAPIERTLAGSHVKIPASWTGTATITIAPLGECPGSTPSTYDDLSADVAMDLAQNIANKAEAQLPDDVPGDAPVITLGVNASGAPSFVLYTSQVGDGGTLDRFWDVSISHGRTATDLAGTLEHVSSESGNTNTLVDGDVTFGDCEPIGTVSLPRALAVGSTLDGHITSNKATFTVQATTTDGRRSVTVQVTAQPME